MSAPGRGRSLTREAGRNIFNFLPSPRRLRSPASPLKQPPWRPAGMPQRRWMTPPNHCSPEPSPRRQSPENTPRQRQAPQAGQDAEIVLTIRSVFQKSVTADKVKDFVLGHLSMAGSVPMEAFRITKYQQRPGEIAISMRVRQTDFGSSTEMVRRLAKALEDPKSRLHRPGSLSSRVFTGARMDVVNPGESQKGWTSPMPTRAHSPPASIGSPEKSSSVGSARRISREPVPPKPRPPDAKSRGRSSGVLGSGRIVPKPKKTATIVMQGKDKVVPKGIKEGQERPRDSIKIESNPQKRESPFLAKLRENILGKQEQPVTGQAAGGYGVTVTPAKASDGVASPRPDEGVVIKHGDAEQQQATNSILEARRGIKQEEARAPDSPGSLSAASAARNIDDHSDEVPVMDTSLWNRTLYGSAAKFAGPMVRSGDTTGESGQAWAVSEVAPYVRGDQLIWKCEVSELLGSGLTRSAESTGPGFGICSVAVAAGKKVDVAMSLVQASLLGYDVDSVCVVGRWVEADKVFKPDWARDLRIEDSITVVAERSAEELSIFVNGHEVHRQYIKGKIPESPRLTIDLLGKVAAVRVLPTADVGDTLASWPLVRGSQRSSLSSGYKKGVIRTKASVSSRSVTESRSSRVSTQEAVSVASGSSSTHQTYTVSSSSRMPERSSVTRSYTVTTSHPETSSATQSHTDSRSGLSRAGSSSSSRPERSSVAPSYSVSSQPGTASVITYPSQTNPTESSYGSRTETVTVNSSGQSYETGSITVTSSASGTAESVTVTDSSGYSSRSESVSVSSSSRSGSYSPSVSVSSSGTEDASSVSVTSSYVSSYSSTSS